MGWPPSVVRVVRISSPYLFSASVSCLPPGLVGTRVSEPASSALAVVMAFAYLALHVAVWPPAPV